MEKNSKIYVAGHFGLVGRALITSLKEKGYTNIITKTHAELDLTRQDSVIEFFKTEKPEYVFLAAAKVGGISANNSYRAEFVYDNLMIQNNIMHQSYVYGVKKLLFLGSTCIYPKACPQPMKEDYLLTSPLEYTNEPYAIAKIAGMKMAESYNIQYGTNFISVMPTNIYGRFDHYDLENSHVLPALFRKIYLATLLQNRDIKGLCANLVVNSEKEALEILSKYGITSQKVEIWGSGKPRREFLYSSDMAEACVFLMEEINFSDLSKNKIEIRNTHINIGTGVDISISDLAITIKEIIGFNGGFTFNTNRPDGTPQKLTNVEKLHNLGWYHKIELKKGIQDVYKWYTEEQAQQF